MAARLLLLTLLWLPLFPAAAVERLALAIGAVEGLPDPLKDIEAELLLDGERPQLRLRIGRMALPPPLGEIVGATLTCRDFRLDTHQAACDDGLLHLPGPLLDNPDVPVRFARQADNGALRVEAGPVKIAGGSVSLVMRHASEGGWHVAVDARRVALERISNLLQPWLPELAPWQLAGEVSLKGEAAGEGAVSHELRLEGRFARLSFSDSDGRHAAEGLAGTLSLRGDGSRRLRGSLNLTHGGAYVDPLYVEVAQDHPLRLEVEGERRTTGFRLSHWRIAQQGVVDAHGSADLAEEGTLHALKVELSEGRFPTLYDTYLKPLLASGAAGNLESSGRISGTLELEEGRLQRAELRLDDLYLDDRGGRFGLYGMSGALGWSARPDPLASSFTLTGGHLLTLELGTAVLRGHSREGGFTLDETLALPIMDGWLMVDGFDLQAREEGVDWHLNGLLTPLPMERLSTAFGWPPLAGKLSGVIPEVSYEKGVLKLGGALLIRLFDGEVVLRDLLLEHPLGVAPVLRSDLELHDLDLELLTRAFSFGRIEGRLEGRVDDLVLEAWRPSSFDARLSTPVDDDSHHRISQRAVDSLTSLGGGPVGALSRSFLRFFEDFSYDRLGIRCRLRNGICTMDGVLPADPGYYIVKGGGIPRIDVIGYSRQVDWDTLLERLEAATRLDEVEIR